MERNRRLALALEIKNPDLSSKLGNPTYSQFLKDYARQNATFVASVEKALADLVTAVNQVRRSASCPLPFSRHRLCCSDCLKDERQNYQKCSVLHFVPELYISTQIWVVVTGLLGSAGLSLDI